MHTPTQEKQLQLASYIYSKHEGKTTENYERFLAYARKTDTLQLSMVGLYVKWQLQQYNTELQAQRNYQSMLTDELKEVLGNPDIIDVISDIDALNLQNMQKDASCERDFLLRLCEIYAIVKELGDVDMRRLKQFNDNPYQHIG